METMKKLFILFKIFMLITIQFVALRAEFGCMDNSYHMQEAEAGVTCDDKKYHYVNCSCPCDEYLQAYDRGRCTKCLHYRAPLTYKILSGAASCH